MEIPKKIRQQIEAGMYRYAEAKRAGKEAEDTKKDLKDELLPLLTAYELKDYALKGLGKLMKKTSTGSSIGEKKLRLALLTRGIDIKLIDESIEEAQTTWSTPYIDFIPEK